MLVAAMVAAFMAGLPQNAPHSPLLSTPGSPPRSRSIVALTFDDGPSSPYTGEILNLLTRYHAHATFFVLGSEVAQFPRIAREIVKQGSVVANHGYRHLNYFQVGITAIGQDAARTEELLKKERIPSVPFYRPPFGNSNHTLVTYMAARGYTLTLWSIDTRDWTGPSTPIITARVLTHIRPNAIVLMHDGGGNRSHTVDALEAILPALTSEGYQFVTMPQYVKDLGLKHAPAKLPLSSPVQTKSSRPS